MPRLLSGKSAFLICSSGNEYPPGAALKARNFQKACLEFILKYISIGPVTTLSVAPIRDKARIMRPNALPICALIGYSRDISAEAVLYDGPNYVTITGYAVFARR